MDPTPCPDIPSTGYPAVDYAAQAIAAIWALATVLGAFGGNSKLGAFGRAVGTVLRTPKEPTTKRTGEP